jgi:hypothetical protein
MRFHAVSYLHNNIVTGIDLSIQTIANMFTYVLWTSAYCMSRWRSNQRGRQQTGQQEAMNIARCSALATT